MEEFSTDDIAAIHAALAEAISSIDKMVVAHDEIKCTLLGRIDELQAIIDSRPALNADLVSAYTRWTHTIYAEEMLRFSRARKDH